MTNEQIKKAIESMKAPENVKKELQKQCDKGDQGARFYVYSLIKRKNPMG